MGLSSVCTFSFQTNYHTLLNPHNNNPKTSLLCYRHPKTPIKYSYNNFPSKHCSTKSFHLQNKCSESLSIAKNSIRAATTNQTEPPESDNHSVATKILNFGKACWKLQRPYTIIAFTSCACGLINKPDLPLASGEISVNTAWIMSIIVALPSFTFLLAFMKSMGSALALIKDASDVEGDTKFGISTLASKYGSRNLTLFCSGIVLLSYVAAILAGIIWPQAFNSNVMLLSHAILAFWLILQTRDFALTNYDPEAGRRFYEFMWKLYYAEYLVYVFI
ncbi:hypothetical protein G4B88_000872 [Cannabis sativa]|uniref:Uncharacterized protein n=1 Tax=Cannabis sativa TaxID=3483 RepID=A0A7J6EQ97_CANSA|nr:hypothetical protein G4B88_000872 [Cannabis sativa]